jgi:hypothetical protein
MTESYGKANRRRLKSRFIIIRWNGIERMIWLDPAKNPKDKGYSSKKLIKQKGNSKKKKPHSQNLKKLIGQKKDSNLG